MRKTRPWDRPHRLTPVVVETGLGLAAVVAGLVALEVGWRGLRSLLGTGLGVDVAPGVAVGGVEGLLTAGSLLCLYGLVGLGVPYAYQEVRGIQERSLLSWPDRRDVQWLAGLGPLLVALVGVGSLLGGLLDASGGQWRVPNVVIGDPAGPLAQFGAGPAAGTVLATVLVTAAALGLGVGGLFHGVLQRSLRRIGSASLAVGGTAAVLGLVFGRPADPVALVVVLAVAASAGIAFERTGNLVVPMAAYALFDAVVLLATYALVYLGPAPPG